MILKNPLFFNLGATAYCGCVFLGTYKNKYDLYYCPISGLKYVYKDDTINCRKVTIKTFEIEIANLPTAQGFYFIDSLQVFKECYIRAAELNLIKCNLSIENLKWTTSEET